MPLRYDGVTPVATHRRPGSWPKKERPRDRSGTRGKAARRRWLASLGASASHSSALALPQGEPRA
jgi:hypothetical protein